MRGPYSAAAMRNGLFWIAVGGLAFWLPVIFVSLALHENVNLWTLNIVPLLGLILLGGASWIRTKHLPKWGWVLAGIYILGPVLMFAPSALIRLPSSPDIPLSILFIVLICIFPPMTLWLSTLNLTILAVLFATVVLPFLAAH